MPSIILQGNADGVEGPPMNADPGAHHFTGFYERRIIPGVGHNVPLEATEAFAGAVLALPAGLSD